MTHIECKKCKYYSNEYGTNFCWYFSCPIKDDFFPCDDFFRKEIKRYEYDNIEEEINHYLYCVESCGNPIYRNFKSQFKEWKEELENKVYQKSKKS